MAELSKGLTVVFRVTDGKWGQRAAAAALMLYEYGMADEVCIRNYTATGSQERLASGYDVLASCHTAWLLCIDADSHIYGDVRQLATGMAEHGALLGIRRSPLQQKGRDGWNEELYRRMFDQAAGRNGKRGYRDLATTCAFLLRSDYARKMLPWIRATRRWADRIGMVSHNYHQAQVAFALAASHVGINDALTWWWEPEQVSFSGEPHGIIHHEAHRHYRFPYRRIGDD